MPNSCNIGHRINLDDNKFLTFARNTNTNFELTGGYSPVAYIPWLIKILPRWITGEDLVTKNATLFANYAKVFAHPKSVLLVDLLGK